jgi:hypothetical protein
MRMLIAAASLAVLGATLGAVLEAVPAVAETHVFIIENHSDYGVDQCLTSGARCGKVVANAYCQSRSYNQVVSFRKVEPDEITGDSAPPACRRSLCGDWVAIECTR